MIWLLLFILSVSVTEAQSDSKAIVLADEVIEAMGGNVVGRAENGVSGAFGGTKFSTIWGAIIAGNYHD